MNQKNRLACPHCEEMMKKWKTPLDGSWEADVHYVCFNDVCSYFVKGWKWMKEKYNVTSSYRHRFDPITGKSSPVPVGSHSALKGDIIEEGD